MKMFPPAGVVMAARKSQALLAMLLSGVDQTTGTTLRDGADGWNCVEVLCHLRDFEEITLRRIRLITNNPRKVVGLGGYGLEIVEQVPF